MPSVHIRFSLARANGRTGRTIEMIQLYWDVLLVQKSAWGRKKSHLLYSFYQCSLAVVTRDSTVSVQSPKA